MKFKKYALKSFIDSFDIVWCYKSFDVFLNGELYYVSFPVSKDVVAVYEWQEYTTTIDKQRIVEEKYDEVKNIFHSTVQVIFDKFPKTIREEVFILLKQYGVNEIPTDLIEIIEKDNRIVQIFTNTQNDRWIIYLLNEFFCCVNNFNAALQIHRYLNKDCKNLIQNRWR